MEEKIHIAVPIIVEGKYDKAKLSGITDAMIITTDGFGIFKNDEKTALIRRVSQNGVIILCDSDGAGGVIRSHLKGSLNGVKTYNLYTSQIKGKEKRKTAPSKEGFLGVEGISAEELRGLLNKLLQKYPELSEPGGNPENKINKTSDTAITKADMYELKLTGFPDSSARRNMVCSRLGLPKNMTPNAMLAAINMISSVTEITEILEQS